MLQKNNIMVPQQTKTNTCGQTPMSERKREITFALQFFGGVFQSQFCNKTNF